MSGKVLDRFVKVAGFAVMTRVLTQDFIGEELNQVFEEHRESQYESIATFQAVAATVADVALNYCENFNQAYRQHQKKLSISRQAFYAKTRGVDAAVCEALVARSAERAAEIEDALLPGRVGLLPGYRCLVVDGNAQAKSDKRLGVLRETCGAPMPGKTVARYDLQRQMFDRAYVLLDGHSQECACGDRIVGDLLPNDVLIADRHYCVVSFLSGIAAAGACFVIRQHGRLKGVLLDKRRAAGRIDTGAVFEQPMRLSSASDALAVRRVTVALDQPTRDGDDEIHVLTNLRDDIDAARVAELYRHRWEEETAFHALQMTLTCEHPGIGHPRAAALLFCLSVLAFNLRQVLFAALYATHDAEEVDEISHFHLSKNVSDHTAGMLVAIPEEEWDRLIPTTTSGLARLLKRIARQISLSDYRKARRGPKKKKPHRSRNVASSHVSTAKLLGIV